MFYVVLRIACFIPFRYKLNVSRLITSVGEANAECWFFCYIDYMQFCDFSSEGFPFLVDAMDRLCHFIVALPGPYVGLF